MTPPLPIVAQCAACGRGYTAAVTRCQICGGRCGPMAPNPATMFIPPSPPETGGVAIGPACPCCDGEPGPHVIAQETRHLKGITWIPARRTYLVTTLKIPGVCALCHRRIERKRLLAALLLPLPLFVCFGLLVFADARIFLLPLLLYLMHLAGQLTYTWWDFLLFGRELSWQLAKYVPMEDQKSLQRYPGGGRHAFFRIGFYPALLLIFAGMVPLVAPMKPGATRATTAAPQATAAVVPAPAPPSARTPELAPAAPARTAPAKTPVEEALRIFRMTPLWAVPVDAATLADPSLGRPAIIPMVIRRQRYSAVRVYYDEQKVPPGVPYEKMNGPTVLAHFAQVKSDGLALGDGQIFLTPAEVAELAAQVSGSVAAPSAILRGQP